MYSNTEWTNSEATKTKLSLSQLNYINDSFIKYFCNSPLKRTPEINRGYYSRVAAIDHAIRSFCTREGANRPQIVNIGAGSDTLFWRLKTDKKITFSRVVDVDSNHVISNKIHLINKCSELKEHLEEISENTEKNLHSKDYHLISCDATKAKNLIELLTTKCDVSKTDPILFVFECVILYWSSDQSNTLIYSLNNVFKSANFVVFDVVNTDDRFARLMQQSLIDRDTPLLGVTSSVTLEDWNSRFLMNGSKEVMSWDMNTVYDSLIARDDKYRIERIEFLDEIELLTQLLHHYCLIIASNYCPVSW